MEKIKLSLTQLIEEVYKVSMEELPSFLFRDIALYAEATRNGRQPNNWKNYILKRDRTGFTIADDKFIELLLKTEKLFNITIMDEEAERIFSLDDLETVVMSKKKAENRKEYFNRAKKHKKIKLILMGQDPYPKLDNGIAFCKDDMKNLSRTSFPRICTSLGLDFKELREKFEDDGIKLFHHLLEEGIMFMNLAYSLLKDARDKKKLFEDGAKENLPTIRSLKNVTVVKLGLNYETEYTHFYSGGDIIVHPSGLARSHENWNKYWGKKPYLKNKYL